MGMEQIEKDEREKVKVENMILGREDTKEFVEYNYSTQ